MDHPEVRILRGFVLAHVCPVSLDKNGITPWKSRIDGTSPHIKGSRGGMLVVYEENAPRWADGMDNWWRTSIL